MDLILLSLFFSSLLSRSFQKDPIQFARFHGFDSEMLVSWFVCEQFRIRFESGRFSNEKPYFSRKIQLPILVYFVYLPLILFKLLVYAFGFDLFFFIVFLCGKIWAKMKISYAFKTKRENEEYYLVTLNFWLKVDSRKNQFIKEYMEFGLIFFGFLSYSMEMILLIFFFGGRSSSNQ